jgi:hypothetical protein
MKLTEYPITLSAIHNNTLKLEYKIRNISLELRCRGYGKWRISKCHLASDCESRERRDRWIRGELRNKIVNRFIRICNTQYQHEKYKFICKKFYFIIPLSRGKLTQLLSLLICILKIFGSNLGRDTDYSKVFIVLFSFSTRRHTQWGRSQEH